MQNKYSEAFWPLMKDVIPTGCQTLSKMPERYVNGVYPKLLDRGKDGRVVDIDGNEYVDLISGLGAISVGYSNTAINIEVVKQLAHGVSFSLPTLTEYHVAKKLCELFPGTEMWKYGKNGVDATLMAIRAARAYTGRKKILVAGYHGCSDHFEALGTRQAGMIDMSEHVVKLEEGIPYNPQDFAAVIIEPYVFDKFEWKNLQYWCNSHDVLFIVDEVVSGGRMPGFSAYQYLGLEPDLVCVGKGLANGFPLSAVGGKKSIMKTFERDDFFASTTFGGEAVSLAACLKTVDILEKALPRMIHNGQFIKDTFNRCFNPVGICKGFPTRLTFDFTDLEHKALFMQEMCKRGVLIGYSNMVMAGHTDFDITQVCNAIIDVYKHWDEFKLEGGMPTQALRMR